MNNIKHKDVLLENLYISIVRAASMPLLTVDDSIRYMGIAKEGKAEREVIRKGLLLKDDLSDEDWDAISRYGRTITHAEKTIRKLVLYLQSKNKITKICEPSNDSHIYKKTEREDTVWLTPAREVSIKKRKAQAKQEKEEARRHLFIFGEEEGDAEERDGDPVPLEYSLRSLSGNKPSKFYTAYEAYEAQPIDTLFPFEEDSSFLYPEAFYNDDELLTMQEDYISDHFNTRDGEPDWVEEWEKPIFNQDNKQVDNYNNREWRRVEKMFDSYLGGFVETMSFNSD